MRLTTVARKQLPNSAFAGPNRTFPVIDQETLDTAVLKIRFAENPEAVKMGIVRRAISLGLRVPAGFVSSSAMKALEEEESDSPLVYFGGTIKALENGVVEGLAVAFGSPTLTDQSKYRDFFTKETDFDLEFPCESASVYYAHGLDPEVGKSKIGVAKAVFTDEGIVASTQLNLEDPFEASLYAKALEGRLGWSTGSLPNLVVRKPQINGSNQITKWPLGKDFTLTEVPAERRCKVFAMKSLLEEFGADEQETVLSLKSLDELVEILEGLSEEIKAKGVQDTWQYRDRLRRVKDAANTILAEYEPMPGSAVVNEVARFSAVCAEELGSNY